MNLQEKLSGIQAETAAANARAAACEQRILEVNANAAKLEAEIMKVLSSPNFPEDKKQRFLERLKETKNKML